MPDAAPVVEIRTPAKPWYRSRTLWFNLGSALLLGVDAAASQVGLLQPLLSARSYAVISALLIIGNVWLRAVTTSGIFWRPPQ